MNVPYRRPLRASAAPGATMIEMLIAVSIFSVGVVGLIGAFSAVEKGVQSSKSGSLANNVAQEQMQILKEQNYLTLIPTFNPSYDASVNPPIPYDTVVYPPTTVLQGSINFTRYTEINVVQENGTTGTLVTLDPTTPDTGMREIIVTVKWFQGGIAKSLQLTSLLANPNTVMSNVYINGTVTDAHTSAAISGATIDVAENVGWRDTTKTNGTYSFGMAPGNYNLTANAYGYFPFQVPISPAPQQTMTENFSLLPMSSGTVTGTVYTPYNDILVTQVVASTMVPVPGYATNQDIEYVELFNPTTSSINIAGYYGCGPEIFYDGSYSSSNYNYGGCWSSFGGFYETTSIIPANSYYLMANTATFVLGGTTITADAYYLDETQGTPSAVFADFIPAGASGGQGWGMYWYYNQSDNWQTWDYMYQMIAYNNTSNSNGYNAWTYSGHAIPLPDGLLRGDQIVRVSSPGYVSTQFARAYASTDTAQNFTWNPKTTPSTGKFYMPYTTHSGTFTAVSGMPAIGAIVTANDGLSAHTYAKVAVSTYSVLPSSQPYATFSLPAVATGTWNVYIDSLPWSQEVDTVTITTQGQIVNIPSTSTYPSLVSTGVPTGYTPMTLSSSTTLGYISGQVTDVYFNPISPVPQVTAGGTTVTCSASGKYLLRLSSGIYTARANPNNGVPSYVYVDYPAITVNSGLVTSGVNFQLSQGGHITGWVTKDGTNGLPNVAVSAQDSNGISDDNEISGTGGYFTLVNLATGVYTITPSLDSLESVSPVSLSATLATAGTTVFSGTFTVTGALGYVSGNVTYKGAPITTGAMILITTSTIAGTPPSLSSAGLTSAAYYVGSSQENGAFSVGARGSTTTVYNVYGYYTTYVGQTPTTVVKSQTSVHIYSSSTTTGVNFAW